MSKWFGIVPTTGQAGYTVECSNREVDEWLARKTFPILGPFDSVEEAEAAVIEQQPHIFGTERSDTLHHASDTC